MNISCDKLSDRIDDHASASNHHSVHIIKSENCNMAMRKILVDETNRELCEHGTVGFPMTVNHDDLWAFEGKSVPIHWHNDLEMFFC